MFDLKAISRLLLQPGVLPVFLVKVVSGFPSGESPAGALGTGVCAWGTTRPSALRCLLAPFVPHRGVAGRIRPGGDAVPGRGGVAAPWPPRPAVAQAPP